MSTTLSAADFAAKWRENAKRESASSQEHFIDLCRLLGVPTPAEGDPSGESYTFEAGVEKLGGGQGWADVWKQDHFGWEYKGKHGNLAAAYKQVNSYRESLGNPPLLVVSDMDIIEVHTNFTSSPADVITVTLNDLAGGGAAEALEILRAVRTDPQKLRPENRPKKITEAAATHFAQIAQSMSARHDNAEAVAHHLNRIIFCLFAEDADLLPERLLTNLIATRRNAPKDFQQGLASLFEIMTNKDVGRYFGNDRVDWFNGGLFDGAEVPDATRDELRLMQEAAVLDWSRIEPAILGTLFERGLDPDKRGQLGAHYTDTMKIMMIIEPVVMQPLRREFAEMRKRAEELLGNSPTARERRLAEAEWRSFLDRLRAVRVLDPACGSGNFLYVALRQLLDLEHETMLWGSERLKITAEFPLVDPSNVLGIEINAYAKELAAVAIWIGYSQWLRDHGYGYPKDPVLKPLDNIELRDAILDYDAEGKPIPATWPQAEFIVGNPPFLGKAKLRESLGDEYVESLFGTWGSQVPNSADLVCYWHELARQVIASGSSKRAGLLATNSIRGGANRAVLDAIKGSGELFLAWSDEPWIVEGAAVRVSIVAQDSGADSDRSLDGEAVPFINSDLTTGADLTTARSLDEGAKLCFEGVKKAGAFDITGETARAMLSQPTNVNGRLNSDVVVPSVNGWDVTRRLRDVFIIDFQDMPHSDAAGYEMPFSHVEKHVFPFRAKNREKRSRELWWQHQRPRPLLRAALEPLSRIIVTPAVAKHRVFVWLSKPQLPDHQLYVFARDDDYTFGVLHSRAHEFWSLRMGTSLEDRPRYTPTTTFETFPFPWPLNTPADALTAQQREHRDAIGAAAKELDDKRRLWLNPPEWVREVPDVSPSLPNRLLPVDDEATEQLRKRTLTNLYNQRPTWLDNLHRTLDAAVFAAYGWPVDIKDEEVLERLLVLNLERAAAHEVK